jgi:hypothetical protein
VCAIRPRIGHRIGDCQSSALQPSLEYTADITITAATWPRALRNLLGVLIKTNPIPPKSPGYRSSCPGHCQQASRSCRRSLDVLRQEGAALAEPRCIGRTSGRARRADHVTQRPQEFMRRAELEMSWVNALGATRLSGSDPQSPHFPARLKILRSGRNAHNLFRMNLHNS